jgi:hypothetical protein
VTRYCAAGLILIAPAFSLDPEEFGRAVQRHRGDGTGER